MLSFQNIIIFLTILFSGLVAGLFYAYSCSVNPGLKALSDVEYLIAMQSINRAIQNPYFFCSFMGLLLCFPYAVGKLMAPALLSTCYLQQQLFISYLYSASPSLEISR